MQISLRATTRWRQRVKSELASYLEVVGPWWDVQTAANNYFYFYFNFNFNWLLIWRWWDVQTAANNYRALHPLKQTTDSDFASNSVRNA